MEPRPPHPENPSANDEQTHGHAPVLLEPILDAFTPLRDNHPTHPERPLALFDATLGRGGHAHALINLLRPAHFVATDLDPHNLEHARQRLAPLAHELNVQLHLHHGPFTDAPELLKSLPIQGFDAVLADLGFASNQVDDPQRGLSFSQDGPLDMRLDPTSDTPTAADLVNTLPQDQLADLIYLHGEERLSRRIARKIVETRTNQPISTTAQLAQIIKAAYPPPRHQKPGAKPKRTPYGGRQKPGHRIHPATRTFQALRIAVNHELDALDQLLEQLPQLINPNDGGTAALISFHSLEDRRVKHAFLEYQQNEHGQRITRKPRTATEREAAQNPRARSAKLRVFEFSPNTDT